MAEEDKEAKQPEEQQGTGEPTDESKDQGANPEEGKGKDSTKLSSSYRDDGV